jgi:REP element-mobilizing transposase RayT
MVTWRPDFKPENLYFVTTTTAGRAPIFHRDLIKRILVDGLYHLHAVDRNDLFAFVIMPNHVRFILRCRADDPLQDVVRDFKANTTRLIVRQFAAEDDREVLKVLVDAVQRPDRQQYKVWEDGYFAKEVFSADFLRQKLDYIHNNPLQPQWQLVNEPEDYIWSSARFYLSNQPALIPLCDARELL